MHTMKIRWIVCTTLATLATLAGCGSWQENAYNAAQNYNQLQCQKNLTADCPKGEVYEAYQKRLKSENPAAQP